MKKDILRLFIKMIYAAIPLYILLFVYFTQDPFKILFVYDKFYENDVRNIMLNRDYVSTEIFYKNYPVYKYNSFIFGSSASVSFPCKDMQEIVGGSWFHFDSFAETIFGINKKFRYLDEHNIDIKNCFIVFDTTVLSVVENNKEGHLFIKHPGISMESKLAFQWEFLSAFLNNKFFIPYVCMKWNISLPQFFQIEPVIHKWTYRYNEINNDKIFFEQENLIQTDSLNYYKENITSFPNMDAHAGDTLLQSINKVQKEMLLEIKGILDKNNSFCKIIIYPAYEKQIFNNNDIQWLESIFGKNNVHNYSGINRITSHTGNYIDYLHVRQTIGADILKNIFESSAK